MSTELLEKILPYKNLNDMDLIDFVRGIVNANQIKSNLPQSEVNVDVYDSALVEELKARIIKATAHFGLPPNLVFENIPLTLTNLVNYLGLMALENEREIIDTVKLLINFPKDFFQFNYASAEDIDNINKKIEFREFIKNQNQILIH